MAQRRRCVLDVARQLIAEVGLDGMTMRQLAERSGVSYSTVYNIYGNKETVVASAVAELFKRQLEQADAYTARGLNGVLDGALLKLDWFAQEILSMPQYALWFGPIWVLSPKSCPCGSSPWCMTGRPAGWRRSGSRTVRNMCSC